MTITTGQAIAIGGKIWTSPNGKITRVYISMGIVARLIDLDVSYYRSGNISSATLGGQDISNAEANRLQNATKVYVQNGEVHVQTASRREDDIRAAIVAEIERVTKPEPVDDDRDDNDTPAAGSETAAPVEQTNPTEQVATLRVTRTVRQIAAALGCAVSTVYRWLRGTNRPSARYAAAIAAIA